MREIKFRGKRLDNGEWIFGDLHIRSYNPHIHSDFFAKTPIDTNTIGQFTGICDYNGTEIFEGDIVKCCYMIPTWGWSEHAEEKEKEVIGVVKYRRGDFCIGEYPMVSFHDSEMEVIGNMYDNPELLKNASNYEND